MKLRRREYGLDVVCYIGERYLRHKVSLPAIRKELAKESGIQVSRRHMTNLFRLFLALMRCRDGDSDVVRERLRPQGRLILQIDAVRFGSGPAVYVIRDFLSEEILYGERIEFPTIEALVTFLRQVNSIGIPVTGIITDKEHALVAAVEAVFPGTPYQFCQTHYLNNLVKGMESDLAELGAAVQEVAQKVRSVAKDLKQKQTAEEPSEELAVAVAVCDTVKMMSRSRGDKILNPAPLKRFNNLLEAGKKVKEAVGNQANRWPVLARLLAILLTLASYAEAAKCLQSQLDIIRNIAHILNTESTGGQVKRLLRRYLNRLKKSGEGSAGAPFIDHVLAVSQRWWERLFTFYDTPDLPPNNNDLERYFGSVKRHQRQVHGRRSTAGGPLDGFAPVFLTIWARLDECPDLMELLHGLPPDAVDLVRKELERLAEPSRHLRSVARAPMKHLADALAPLTTG